MELLYQCAAVSVLCAVLCLIVRRVNPEMSLAVSSCAAAVILLAVLKSSGSILRLNETVNRLIGDRQEELKPVLKCVVIAAVTKLSAELCRDSSQSTLAAAMELAGTVCAAAVCTPVILRMLTLIGEMV